FRQQLVQAQAGELNQRIEQALHEIGSLGARLAVTQSLADLKRYRQAVGMLLHDLTSHTLQVQTETDWDAQTWEQRSMVILRRVNEELENLTSMILAEEKDHLAILAKIDEIRGLLLDMRM
ncbi:MAG: YaaR family protein, partial [Mycobacterium leprae]